MYTPCVADTAGVSLTLGLVVGLVVGFVLGLAMSWRCTTEITQLKSLIKPNDVSIRENREDWSYDDEKDCHAEPEFTSASPAFLSGKGTAKEPFVVSPAVCAPGESVSSVATILISNLEPDSVVHMNDQRQGVNDGRFDMVNVDTVRTAAAGGPAGEASFKLHFRDDAWHETPDGEAFSAVVKAGLHSVYFSWKVTVTKHAEVEVSMPVRLCARLCGLLPFFQTRTDLVIEEEPQEKV